MNEDSLHDYQKAAVEHIISKKHCGLFLEMGLGKTVSTLTAVKKLIYEELEIENALVIGPKRVAESVWDAECEKWEHLKHLKVVKIAGSAKQRKQALAEKADVYTIGRDNVAWLCGQYGGSMLPFGMLVVDESSSFKNPSSIRFKSLRNVQPSFKRVVILTGTPAPNGLIDIWSQIYLLDRGERLGKFITRFREDYFKPAKTNGAIVYSYAISGNGEELIHEKISDICMSMKAKDYLSLPGRMENIIEIKFDAALQKRYDDFERDQVLSLFADSPEDEGISAVNAASLSNKLLQFANGAVYDSDKNYHIVHDLKIEALKEIVEDANGKPVLIAYTYRHDLERIMIALKSYKPKQLKIDQDIKDWNSGKIQVMVMHPASGGHGLNLQAGGNIIVWFGQTWSLELEQQFNARLDRQGQKDVVIIHKLVASKTLDQDVIKSQESKSKKQDALMEAVKAKIKKYISIN
jgi:SNF2 family DNA or RNA helicase